MREHNIGKVENGILITPTENEYRKIVITNPTEEQMKYFLGYSDIDKKQIASVVTPEYDESAQEATEEYFINEETNKINLRFVVTEISLPIEEDTN